VRRIAEEKELAIVTASGRSSRRNHTFLMMSAFPVKLAVPAASTVA
jgi:hypothetical protein